MFSSGVYSFLLYLIAYVPPQSGVGSCHQIEVKVDRRDAFVDARSKYCNTKHSPSDPLYAKNGILGMVYRKDGTLATRFSDFGCRSPNLPAFYIGGSLSPYRPHPERDHPMIPNRYETQIDLPPGECRLLLVLSHGSKFGRGQTPLTVESYDRKQLGVSSLALCKRFHEAAAVNPAPDLVLLVSKGVEFTPAGDTRFKKHRPFNKGEPRLPSLKCTNRGLPRSQPRPSRLG